MTGTELEERMTEFINGQLDDLLQEIFNVIDAELVKFQRDFKNATDRDEALSMGETVIEAIRNQIEKVMS